MARQKWKEWAENEDRLTVLASWARAGLTDEQIAKKIGISRSTLSEWKKRSDSISSALSPGKEFADRMVEGSLYRSAIGFYVNEEKVFKVKIVDYDESGKKIQEREELQTAQERHYIKGDIKAQIFWLKNRMPEVWKEKIMMEEAEEEGDGVIILTPTQIEKIQKEVKKDG